MFLGARTPKAITADVLLLCELVCPGVDPRFLRVAPADGCNPATCFANVSTLVERFGGHAQFGWSIWIWPRVFVEAEHHAVYAPPDGGAWRDVTPGTTRGLKRRLFLPDDGAVWTGGPDETRRDNIRVALTHDPLLAEVLAGADERTRVWRSGAETTAAERQEIFDQLQGAELAQVYAQTQLALKLTPPNAPCFCGRKKRFKQCHGRRK